MSKQVLTIYRNEWYSSNGNNVITKVELDTKTSNNSGNLSLSNNCIKIGAGISKVKVSGRLSYDTHSYTGEVDMAILKNNNAAIYIYGGEDKSNAYTAFTLMPQILDVQENDEIGLAYNKLDNKSLHINGNISNNLTVEVIA